MLLFVVFALVAAGCRQIDTEHAFDALDGELATPVAVPTPTAVLPPTAAIVREPPPLPFSGPTMRSHWHAAFIVRICDRILDPLPDVNENKGIHSHGDGLIHIHPSTPETAFERATISDFFATIGVTVSDTGAGDVVGSVPGQRDWTNGDRCGDEPGEWTLHRWARVADDDPIETVRADLGSTRFLNDGEMFSLNFAPVDAPPIRPITTDELFAASPALLEPLPAPFLALPAEPDGDTLSIWPIELITEAPCGAGFVPAQDESRCYQRGSVVVNRSDIQSATAYLVGPVPGIVMEVDPAKMTRLNDLLANRPDGQQLALEINGRVQLLAFTPGPFPQPRITIAGGISVEDAKLIAEILSTPI